MSVQQHAASDAARPAPSEPLQPSRIRPGANRLRLQTLVRLRWLAVAGQTIAVLFVYFGLGFPAAARSVSRGHCHFRLAQHAAGDPLPGQPAAAQPLRRLLLAYDVMQLAVLLFLTGGLQNPFSFLFLVPATVSASTLPSKRTMPIVLLTFAVASLLAFFHLPLPWTPGEPLVLPRTYIAGIWTALVCGLGFLGIYVWRISLETKRMSDALTATEMVLAREQQLSALDGLAAAAAHELGTPLATIALVSKELKREFSGDAHHAEDVDLLISQTQRCREILSTLTLRDDPQDKVFGRLKLSVMLEEVAEPLRGGDVDIAVSARADEDAAGDDRNEPFFARNPGILYGIANLVDNALDFAEQRVDVSARWDGERISISIEDDGPGFAQEVIDKLGEPYVTTRPGEWASAYVEEGAHDGMGLGFFIAKTLLERSGAAVAMANRPHPTHGAIVRIVWPRAEIEADRS